MEAAAQELVHHQDPRLEGSGQGAMEHLTFAQGIGLPNCGEIWDTLYCMLQLPSRESRATSDQCGSEF